MPLYHIWPEANGHCPHTGMLWRRALGEREGSHRPPWSRWLSRSRAGAGWVWCPWTQGSDATGQHITAMTRGSKTFPDHSPGLHFLVPMAMQGQPQSQPWLQGWHVHPAASVLPVPGPCLAWCWEIFGPAFGCLVFSFLCNTGLCNGFCSTSFLCPAAS